MDYILFIVTRRLQVHLHKSYNYVMIYIINITNVYLYIYTKGVHFYSGTTSMI
jgi:hypothetical protein